MWVNNYVRLSYFISTDTEIDWSTYMEQVECFKYGERNYSMISGATGPLVYPAGHLYIYSVFHSITNGGKTIVTAQYIFTFLYLVNLLTVLLIHAKVQLVNRLDPTAYHRFDIWCLNLGSSICSDTRVMHSLPNSFNFCPASLQRPDCDAILPLFSPIIPQL